MVHPRSTTMLIQIRLPWETCTPRNLLGQLRYLVQDLRIVPIALAGTSAGAIIAALLWSGLSIDQIQAGFRELAEQGRLLDLLGPFDGFTMERLNEWVEQTNKRKKFIEFMMSGIDTEAGGTFPFLLGLLYAMPHVLKSVKPIWRHFGNGGLFDGRNLEYTLDAWIRKSPLFRGIQPKRELLTFGDVHDAGIPVPPLFLIATNLRTGSVEPFNSLCEHCREIPIARAARASASFPGVFRPIRIAHGSCVDPYLDGGLVSNFPSWVFASSFRQQLAKFDAWRDYSRRSWLHFGLRLAPSHDPFDFQYERNPKRMFGAMSRILTGGTRDRLENIISNFVQPMRLIWQRQTGAPSHVMAVDKITPTVVDTMVDLGYRAAKSQIQDLRFELSSPSVTSEINARLERFAAIVTSIFGTLGLDGRPPRIRVGVYIPFGGPYLILRFAHNMNNADIDERALDFNKTFVGLSFRLSQPIRAAVAGVDFAQAGLEPFRNRDTTFVTTAPIRNARDWSRAPERPAEPTLRDDLQGLLGIISMDANFNLGQNPATMINRDSRFLAMYDMLRCLAEDVALLLVRSSYWHSGGSHGSEN